MTSSHAWQKIAPVFASTAVLQVLLRNEITEAHQMRKKLIVASDHTYKSSDESWALLPGRDNRQSHTTSKTKV